MENISNQKTIWMENIIGLILASISLATPVICFLHLDRESKSILIALF